MTLVPRKVSNKEFKYCFAARMFPLALIALLFVKNRELEKKAGDWACNHIKLESNVNALEEKIKALTSHDWASDRIKLELEVHDLEEKIKALTSQN